MVSFFKKSRKAVGKYHYRNLSIDLPKNWTYEQDDDGQLSCFEPTSQSTLRISILRARSPRQPSIDSIISLTGGLPYHETVKGYILTEPAYIYETESGQEITLVSWRLINPKTEPTSIAVLTYTHLTSDSTNPKEMEVLAMIEKSLQGADLI